MKQTNASAAANGQARIYALKIQIYFISYYNNIKQLWPSPCMSSVSEKFL